MVAPYVLYAQERHIRKAGLTLPSSQVHYAGQHQVSLLYLLWAARFRISVSFLLSLRSSYSLTLTLAVSLELFLFSLSNSRIIFSNSHSCSVSIKLELDTPNLPYPRFHAFNLFTIPTLL